MDRVLARLDPRHSKLKPLEAPEGWFAEVRNRLGAESYPDRAALISLLDRAENSGEVKPLIELVERATGGGAIENEGVRSALGRIATQFWLQSRMRELPIRPFRNKILNQVPKVNAPTDLARLLRGKGYTEYQIRRMMSDLDDGTPPKNMVI
jgi:hypothetical protein